MIDLLELRIGNAERTMQNNLSSDCYFDRHPPTGGKPDRRGCSCWVADVANGGKTVGGIDLRGLGVLAEHGCRVFAAAGADARPPPRSRTIHEPRPGSRSRARPGQAGPSFSPTTPTFRYYWESLPGDPAHHRGSQRAMAGFASLKFMDADVVYDGGFQGNSTGNVSVLGLGRLRGSRGRGRRPRTLYPAQHRLHLPPPAQGSRHDAARPRTGFSVNQGTPWSSLIAWAGNMTMSKTGSCSPSSTA